MAKSDDAGRALEIALEREFAAPRSAVFREWLEPESIRDWFAPDTYVTTACEVDARVGGRFRLEYVSESGHRLVERGEFRELVEPSRLVLALTQVLDGSSSPETLVTVTFSEVQGVTRMSFLQTGFDSAERRDGNAEGWGGCFEKLSLRLRRERSQQP